ncbi:hypothetical protein, partial [Klebsiella pneumoniae]|uniref:hypothetical protein n=1 Tax=Klebsiella pneumoniae TaxID=573 RepID=UPI00272FDD13
HADLFGGLFVEEDSDVYGNHRKAKELTLKERLKGEKDTLGPAPVANYDAMWSSIYSNAGPGLSAYNIRMPAVAGQPATVYYLLKDS